MKGSSDFQQFGTKKNFLQLIHSENYSLLKYIIEVLPNEKKFSRVDNGLRIFMMNPMAFFEIFYDYY